MPNNSLEYLRSGLVNCIGGIVNIMHKSGIDGDKANRLLVAMLVEETLKASQPDTNKPCNLAILKPYLDGLDAVMQQQVQFMAKAPNKDKMIHCQQLRDSLLTVMKDFCDGKISG